MLDGNPVDCGVGTFVEGSGGLGGVVSGGGGGGVDSSAMVLLDEIERLFVK